MSQSTAEIHALESELSTLKATQSRNENAERVAKWREALAACHAQRDRCNALAAEVRLAIANRERAYQGSYKRALALQEFESSIPVGDYIDFRTEAEIEKESVMRTKLREAYETACRVAQPTNGQYGQKFSEWMKAVSQFENLRFREQRLRPQPPQKKRVS